MQISATRGYRLLYHLFIARLPSAKLDLLLWWPDSECGAGEVIGFTKGMFGRFSDWWISLNRFQAMLMFGRFSGCSESSQHFQCWHRVLPIWWSSLWAMNQNSAPPSPWFEGRGVEQQEPQLCSLQVVLVSCASWQSPWNGSTWATSSIRASSLAWKSIKPWPKIRRKQRKMLF